MAGPNHGSSSSTFLLLLLLVVLPPPPGLEVEAVGVNWGSASSDPLPASKVVGDLLLRNSISRVRLPDADPVALSNLSGTGIGVVVGVPNAMLPFLNASLRAARSWVRENVTRYYSSSTAGVKIEYIAVGDEPFLVSYGQQFQHFVLGAASNIQAALDEAKLAKKVKVVVPCNSDAYFSSSSLPSKSQFRPDLNKTMVELLAFLSKHGSPFMVSIDPFLIFQQNRNFSLGNALFQSTSHPLTDGHKKYQNIFDAEIDALVTSLSKSGFGDMDIMVGKIGWPTDGAVNASVSVAEIFLQGLVDHLQSGSGTPLRPKRFPTETFIFSLLDENERSIGRGYNFERHWGIFTFDGQAKYNVDLGQGSRDLANARNVDYLPWRWCVLDNNKNISNVSAIALEACMHADCTALSVGGSCSRLSWPGNISYTFNSYYQHHDQSIDSCNFGGLGLITSVDPSDDECRFFVGLRLSASTSLNIISTITWVAVIVQFFITACFAGFGL